MLYLLADNVAPMYMHRLILNYTVQTYLNDISHFRPDCIMYIQYPDEQPRYFEHTQPYQQINKTIDSIARDLSKSGLTCITVD